MWIIGMAVTAGAFLIFSKLWDINETLKDIARELKGGAEGSDI